MQLSLIIPFLITLLLKVASRTNPAFSRTFREPGLSAKGYA